MSELPAEERRVWLLESTADNSFRVEQVRPGFAGSREYVRREDFDRLREALIGVKNSGSLSQAKMIARAGLSPSKDCKGKTYDA